MGATPTSTADELPHLVHRGVSLKNIDIVVSGVGGQGVILLTEILGEAALKEGFGVIISEIHGMAQRGGSVASHVRIGSDIYSPTIMEGTADVILGFEPIETLRVLKFAGEDAVIIMNSKPVTPITVSTGAHKYPTLNEVVDQCMKFTKSVNVMNAFEIAKEAGNSMAMNMVLLGALAGIGLLPIPNESFIKNIKMHVPGNFVGVNLRAFRMGKSALSHA